MSSDESSFFRPEAVEHHAAGAGREGHVLRIHPDWVNWAYWLLVIFLTVLAGFLVLAPVNEYARGPAIVRADGRDILTAISAGTVVAVTVDPGEPVEKDQVLVRLENAEELATLKRIQQEIEMQTRKVLANLSDTTARSTLTRLHAEEEFALAALEAKLIRAPHDGTVRDIRIRSNQYLAPGQVALSLLRADVGFSVVALLPGESRPMLNPGDELRLEISGFPYSYQGLTIDTISEEVVGPEEARRFLGPEVGDALIFSGPVVLVKAKLRSGTFEAEGQSYRYFDGLAGIAEARTNRESALIYLIPGLKSVFRKTHE